MSKSDVKMENAENLPHSGNIVQELETKSLYAKTEGDGEKVVCIAAISGDAFEMQNGDEEENKSVNEDKDKAKVNIVVKDGANPINVETEPVEGSIHEKNETKVENEKSFNSKTKDEEKPASISNVDKQFDSKKGVVLHSASIDTETQEHSSENGMDAGNLIENVEKTLGELVEEKMHNDIDMERADHVEHVEGDTKIKEQATAGKIPSHAEKLPIGLSANKTPETQNFAMDEVPQGGVESMEDTTNFDEDKRLQTGVKEHSGEIVLACRETGDENGKSFETVARHEGEEFTCANDHEPVTPNSLVRHSPAKAGNHSGVAIKTVFTLATLPLDGESDDGTLEEQATFMKEIESFYRETTVDFKPPKFYGQPLNCLKLWRAVIRLGGYDRVTGSKLWRQVGESFHPPKTCTTVSWTFRIFYEKSLLEYERHKVQSGELQLPVATHPEASGIDVEGNGYQGSGPGRARRDAAARAMHGWHVQRLSDYGEVGEPIIKDKNLNNVAKREKNLKSIGSLKQKRPSEVEQSNKAARTEPSKQLATSVVDVGPSADWVKINVRQAKDCFEVYALVPGLLREEVRVQSDPAGRVVITGQPEQVDNPWGITPFKKIVSLPERINPLQTSAVVSLHGRLLVRVPFEDSHI